MKELCESLKLSLMVDSDDMSYHWKFEELMDGKIMDYCGDQ
jgi:hypothetical protein